MKRSHINRVIESAKTFFASHGFVLPPFAFWTPADWAQRGPEADEIRRHRLGWDVTDFGSGRFDRCGLTLFTLRNRVYCEKIMMVGPEQVTPFHFHFSKTEDIINRGAGRLMVRVYNSTPDERFADSPVRLSCDGVLRELPAGGTVTLDAGQSVTLTPGMYHELHAPADAAPALIGEVSSVNDDATDNRFLEALPRYAAIEEDQPPLHMLCQEYPAAP